ncbi:hypothetical protein BpHYR1_048710 [Brachionus plicatilis]|uniref:Uncharacterized protein n=1 Tax=Brachionus plicatilis TaxID=10195 RepID=A0A3M7PRH7_BRAPC|nr:hypothetical protein BpHYR1_048710 [Brachionus plicatilis]
MAILKFSHILRPHNLNILNFSLKLKKLLNQLKNSIKKPAFKLCSNVKKLIPNNLDPENIRVRTLNMFRR